jgi:hypothetical protein
VVVNFFTTHTFFVSCAACDAVYYEKFPNARKPSEMGGQTVVGSVKFVATVKWAPQLTVFS